ncbi:MAG: M20/M25/M40 family metallo-hydrolase [Bacteroidetes bacterium]|nr:M20/M25/M40 family metallo-hydrolase [Bacteroidota bacterium]
MKRINAFILLTMLAIAACAPKSSSNKGFRKPYDSLTAVLVTEGLRDGQAFAMLENLTKNVGTRLSGSEGASKGVEWAQANMERLGFDTTWLEPVMVPHWVRSNTERAQITRHQSGKRPALKITALGGTIGTPDGGIEAEVVEVHSFEELQSMGDRAKGKIVFFNRPMDPTKFYPGEAYGGAVNQRTSGASEAARAGGLAALVRSMTMRLDDNPHTGAMRYNDSLPKVPTAAVSTIGANLLSEMLKQDPHMKVKLELGCQILPDVESFNVIGEYRGTALPNDVVLIGGHLDSWDIGEGAHDDGAGVVHCLEAVRLLKNQNLRPKRTIRVVLFMNEENGLKGAKAYAAVSRPGTKHVAAIETDAGGFSPRSFSSDADSIAFPKLKKLEWVLVPMDMNVVKGHSGADISQLIAHGVPTIGLRPDYHRYFDHHHSAMDVLENVHPRELELGAVAMAAFAYALAEEGLN